MAAASRSSWASSGAIEAITWPDGTRTELEARRRQGFAVARNAAGTIAHTFDAAGNPLTEETPGGTVRYAYDPEGRLTELAAPGGETIAYTYDVEGRVDVIRDWQGRETRIVYAKDGAVAEIRYGNGAVERQQYARVGRLESTYLIGPDGRCLPASRAYTYDVCERLTGVTDHLGETRRASGASDASPTTPRAALTAEARPVDEAPCARVTRTTRRAT